MLHVTGGGNNLTIEGKVLNLWSGVTDWWFTPGPQKKVSLISGDRKIVLERRRGLFTLMADEVGRARQENKILAQFPADGYADFHAVELEGLNRGNPSKTNSDSSTSLRCMVVLREFTLVVDGTEHAKLLLKRTKADRSERPFDLLANERIGHNM